MAQFEGKLLFDEQGNFVSIKVVKGGVANSNIKPPYGVDAVSGGSITSKGLEKMLENSIQPYVPYLKELQNKTITK